MKTEALRQALDKYGFDAAFGGTRRDGEKSRAKKCIFSLRGPGQVWDPRAQRPELWSLFNTHTHQGESMRIFPLLNWTVYDVWDYTAAEDIPVVPLYFAAPRSVMRRAGTWIMLDDAWLLLNPGESPETKMVHFRTLGC